MRGRNDNARRFYLQAADILKNIEKILGRNLTLKDMGSRPGDPKFAVADIRKIQKELGWEPRIGLDEGLQRTIAYYKKRYDN